MASGFTRPALVCNLRSGSSDEALVGRLTEMCRAADAPLVRTIILPDEDSPSLRPRWRATASTCCWC